MQLVEIANGYQLTTRSEYANWIKKLNKIKVSTKLSKPAMETLAIIAYKQPIIKPEVEKIRGVDSGGVIKTLLERKLIKIIGRMDIVGKPMMYGTTSEFLQYFGLKDLTDLPTLREFQELKEEEVPVTASAKHQIIRGKQFNTLTYHSSRHFIHVIPAMLLGGNP